MEYPKSFTCQGLHAAGITLQTQYSHSLQLLHQMASSLLSHHGIINLSHHGLIKPFTSWHH